MKNELSEAAKEWLNTEYSYNNPWNMNSQTVWDVLQKAKRGHNYAIEVWDNYRHKVRLPEAKDVTLKSYTDLVNRIYENLR